MVGYTLVNRSNGVVHQSLHCPHIANRVVVEVDGTNGRRLCRNCCRTAHNCLICADATQVFWRGCREHVLCSDCLEHHITHQLENPQWDGQVRCPCGEFAQQDLPQTLQRRVHERLDEPQREEPTDPLHRIVERTLTQRCPHCEAAFYDFTGCAAVMCRCGGYFCACCLEGFSGNQECHDHVRTCPWNHKRDFWIDTQTLAQIMHDRRCERAWTEVCVIARETQSLVYAWGVALRIHKIDGTAFVPYHLRSLLYIPAFTWWVLLCLMYPVETLVFSAMYRGAKFVVQNVVS